jgi:hypothetical protein
MNIRDLEHLNSCTQDHLLTHGGAVWASAFARAYQGEAVAGASVSSNGDITKAFASTNTKTSPYVAIGTGLSSGLYVTFKNGKVDVGTATALDVDVDV